MELRIYQDDSMYVVHGTAPYSEIYETKSLRFELASSDLLNSPLLLIADMKVELSEVRVESDCYFYSSKISNYFINNVGVAIIEYEDNDGSDILSLGTVNVLSSKITTSRLRAMLEYICLVDVQLLHCCFSKTFLGSDGGKFEYTDLLHKLISTEKTINFLWDNRHKFKNQPCKRVKTIERVKKYTSKDLIDDRGYSWLLSHLDELEVTSGSDGVVLNRYGKNLSARHISTATVVDDKDIFENQVIYTFLVAVKSFVGSISDQQSYFRSDLSIKSGHVDIVPFIQNFVSDKFSFRNKLVARINSLVDNCINFINTNFTRTYIPNVRPRVTQYAARHNHYVSLYKMINDWWNIDASSISEYESVEQLLFSIKSMDKIYELFVLLKLLNAFHKNSLRIKEVKYLDFSHFPSLSTENELDKKSFDTFNFYNLENDVVAVNIYLEPVIFPFRKNLEEGELFIIDKPSDSRSADKLTRAKKVRTPDYVIEIMSKRTSARMIYVLDAKYSKFETVLYERLPSKPISKHKKVSPGLVDKYLYGIRVNHLNSAPDMVDGVFATYIAGNPDIRRKVVHGVSEEFGLWGDFPMRPFIDLIEFAPVESSEDEMSQDFINKLFSFTVAEMNRVSIS
ncbi:hypothetical protein ACFOEW_00490 [Alteromonas oceani]|uniref:DUF2357 domain-containing protein n=1 Tax=Alteromonas oceani TaxID=2071609 RepID=A0ABV7JQM7_9ALTE|nr:hypothetical protein [Alteromonas oceani]